MKTAQRLFVSQPLGPDRSVLLDAGQAHYLVQVLRLVPGTPGATVHLFNGQDGEWLARLDRADRKGGQVRCTAQLRPQDSVPDLMLCFAPIKGDRLEAIVEKATELGAATLVPVVTDRTIVRRLNEDRLAARAVEAAEQTGRLSVPAVRPALSLPRLLEGWEPGRTLLFADEAGDAPPLAAVARQLDGPLACLTGPEGGFTPAERALVRGHSQARAVSLGPRILRADTAAFAALAIVQSVWGDWTAVSAR